MTTVASSQKEDDCINAHKPMSTMPWEIDQSQSNMRRIIDCDWSIS